MDYSAKFIHWLVESVVELLGMDSLYFARYVTGKQVHLVFMTFALGQVLNSAEAIHFRISLVRKLWQQAATVPGALAVIPPRGRRSLALPPVFDFPDAVRHREIDSTPFVLARTCQVLTIHECL